ncbi:MAG TPA: hypothetical protein VHP63_08420 [candidate division Zixibacteria bacterium]|nr:hypothetical protein [candidate division Zixibacteria bacterium]
MFEKRRQPVLPAHRFIVRLVKSLGTALAIVLVALALGIAGYHWIVGLSWIDALLNASMILTGMGPIDQMSTTGDKLFASIYALFSGLIFVSVTALILIPIGHRIMHMFHHHKNEYDAS